MRLSFIAFTRLQSPSCSRVPFFVQSFNSQSLLAIDNKSGYRFSKGDGVLNIDFFRKMYNLYVKLTHPNLLYNNGSPMS